MRKPSLPLLLGLAHAVADGAAGMLLGDLPRVMDLKEVSILVLLYNVLAFGAQPLVGLVTDRLRRPRATALTGLSLLGAGLLLSTWRPSVAVLLAGLGSAAFHVGGGALALCAAPARASGPGLFAAPGVVGLAAGGALAVAGYATVWPFLLGLALLAFAIALSELPELPYASRETEPLIEGHDLLMVALLAAIAMRSAIWSALEYMMDGRVDVLLMLAVAAAAGKVLGGYMADRFGWRRWTTFALGLAAPLLTFGGERLLTLLPGVALLQSATPVGLAVASQILPAHPGLASGLTLGLAVAVGGVPTVLGLGARATSPAVVLTAVVTIVLLLRWVIKVRSGRPAPPRPEG